MNLTRRFLKLWLLQRFTVLSSRETGSTTWGWKTKPDTAFLEMALPSKHLAMSYYKWCGTIIWTQEIPKSEARFSQEYAQNDHILWAKTGWLLKRVSASSLTEHFKFAWIKVATQTAARRLPLPSPPPDYPPPPLSFLGPLWTPPKKNKWKQRVWGSFTKMEETKKKEKRLVNFTLSKTESRYLRFYPLKCLC